jgi:hypothetical protein
MRNAGKYVKVCGPVLAAVVALLGPVVEAAADTPTVRMTRPAAGRIVLDVSDATVAIRKEVTADRSEVTLTTDRDRLTVSIRRGVVTMSGPGGSITVEPASDVDSDRLLMVLQRSEAARRARALLARLEESPSSFAGQSMLLTRAMLEIGTGSVNALNEHRKWVAERQAQMPVPSRTAGAPKVFKASFDMLQKYGPGDCWDLYSKEAVRIAQDFEECTDDLAWYEAHKWAGCTLIYTVRSEAAMAWFISCNGGVPFSG